MPVPTGEIRRYWIALNNRKTKLGDTNSNFHKNYFLNNAVLELEGMYWYGYACFWEDCILSFACIHRYTEPFLHQTTKGMSKICVSSPLPTKVNSISPTPQGRQAAPLDFHVCHKRCDLCGKFCALKWCEMNNVCNWPRGETPVHRLFEIFNAVALRIKFHL